MPKEPTMHHFKAVSAYQHGQPLYIFAASAKLLFGSLLSQESQSSLT